MISGENVVASLDKSKGLIWGETYIAAADGLADLKIECGSHS